MATQLQHLCKGLTSTSISDQSLLDSLVNILIYTTKVVNVPTGLEASAFAKSNCLEQG